MWHQSCCLCWVGFPEDGVTLNKAGGNHESSDDSTVLGSTRFYSHPRAFYSALWWEYSVRQSRSRTQYLPGTGRGDRYSYFGRGCGDQRYRYLCAAVACPLGPYPGVPV